MSNFGDSSLKTGVFFADLLASIKDGCVQPEFITAGQTPEGACPSQQPTVFAVAHLSFPPDAMANAKYVLSVARKLGAVIFLLPEDICEVKPKMILTFVGSLMAVAKKQGK